MDEERHGYGIMLEVSRLTGGATRMGPGTLYGTLKRMLASQLIEESDERRDPSLDDERRRYYRITAAGRGVLGEQKTAWNRFFDALHRVVGVREG